MGTVYAAQDPRLDRQIALKVLRHEQDAGEENLRSRRSRLLREARAMARLAHPNVGTVYDVGVLERDGEPPQVWIAMELVDGEGLRQWCTRARPSVREILAAYVQFGRGLAAAHAAGLVHRDVKPDNAMRDASGRVRVLDFGLARSVEESLHTASDLDVAKLDAVDISTFTRTGALLGTPAYMAPEQFGGQIADAASDQYAYCVALFEACVGGRPHRGTTVAQIAAARRADAIEPWTRTDVPRAVRRAVLRGLSHDPAARWPTMDDLVGVLERSLTPRRTGWWVAGVATSALAGIAAWSALREDACVDATRELEAVWAVDDRVAAFARIAAIGGTFAGSVGERLAADVDRYATSWATAHPDT
jgi:eukaryotic-like serine/threonine-protein kinase